MNAYVNDRGDVLAVFASYRGRYRGRYTVFVRPAGKLEFEATNRHVFPIRETRAEAEEDMRIYATTRSYDLSWTLVENWKG